MQTTTCLLDSSFRYSSVRNNHQLYSYRLNRKIIYYTLPRGYVSISNEQHSATVHARTVKFYDLMQSHWNHTVKGSGFQFHYVIIVYSTHSQIYALEKNGLNRTKICFATRKSTEFVWKEHISFFSTFVWVETNENYSKKCGAYRWRNIFSFDWNHFFFFFFIMPIDEFYVFPVSNIIIGPWVFSSSAFFYSFLNCARGGCGFVYRIP